MQKGTPSSLKKQWPLVAETIKELNWGQWRQTEQNKNPEDFKLDEEVAVYQLIELLRVRQIEPELPPENFPNPEDFRTPLPHTKQNPRPVNANEMGSTDAAGQFGNHCRSDPGSLCAGGDVSDVARDLRETFAEVSLGSPPPTASVGDRCSSSGNLGNMCVQPPGTCGEYACSCSAPGFGPTNGNLACSLFRK